MNIVRVLTKSIFLKLVFSDTIQDYATFLNLKERSLEVL